MRLRMTSGPGILGHSAGLPQRAAAVLLGVIDWRYLSISPSSSGLGSLVDNWEVLFFFFFFFFWSLLLLLFSFVLLTLHLLEGSWGSHMVLNTVRWISRTSWWNTGVVFGVSSWECRWSKETGSVVVCHKYLLEGLKRVTFFFRCCQTPHQLKKEQKHSSSESAKDCNGSSMYFSNWNNNFSTCWPWILISS